MGFALQNSTISWFCLPIFISMAWRKPINIWFHYGTSLLRFVHYTFDFWCAITTRAVHLSLNRWPYEAYHIKRAKYRNYVLSWDKKDIYDTFEEDSVAIKCSNKICTSYSNKFCCIVFNLFMAFRKLQVQAK